MGPFYHHVKSVQSNINNGAQLITFLDPFNHHLLSRHGEEKCIILDSMTVFSIILKSVIIMPVLYLPHSRR